MPRSKYVPEAILPHHITARCINKDWFKVDLEEVWNIFSNQLHFVARAFNARIHSFVLMGNHFHLIMTTPEANLANIMQTLMRETSKAITSSSGRINQTYGGPYHSTKIDSDNYFLHSYKYVYRNPVTAGLCRNVEEYKYSTLPGLLGLNKMWIPVVEDTILFDNVEEVLKWLNKRPKDNDYKAVRNALRKNSFKLSNDRATNKAHRLELAKF